MGIAIVVMAITFFCAQMITLYVQKKVRDEVDAHKQDIMFLLREVYRLQSQINDLSDTEKVING